MSFFFFFFLLGMIFQPEISVLITSRYQHLVSCHTRKFVRFLRIVVVDQAFLRVEYVWVRVGPVIHQVPSSLQQTPLYCDKVKEAVEREILQNIAAHDMTSSRLNAPSDASPDSETPTETLTPSPGVKKHKGMSEP
jgi:hypothetical protein